MPLDVITGRPLCSVGARCICDISLLCRHWRLWASSYGKFNRFIFLSEAAMEVHFSALPFQRTSCEGRGKVTASSRGTSGTFGPLLTSILGPYSPKTSLSQWLDGGVGLSWPNVGSPWWAAFTLDSASAWLKLSLNRSQVRGSSCPILPHPLSFFDRQTCIAVGTLSTPTPASSSSTGISLANHSYDWFPPGICRQENAKWLRKTRKVPHWALLDSTDH